MHARLEMLLALLVAVPAVACSRDSEGGASTKTEAAPAAPARTSSCDRITKMSLCSEYSGVHLAQNEAVISASCAKLGGTFVGAECPNTNVLGSCSISTPEVRKFYASGAAAYDASKAEAECAGPYKGKWSAFK